MRVVAIIDDSPGLQGGALEGRPIIAPGSIDASGVEAVILSSDTFEDELWHKTTPLRRRGLPVLRLYGREIEQG